LPVDIHTVVVWIDYQVFYIYW